MSIRKQSIGAVHYKMFGPAGAPPILNFFLFEASRFMLDEKIFPDGNGGSDAISVIYGGAFPWPISQAAGILSHAIATGQVSSPYDTTVWASGSLPSGDGYVYVVSGYVPNHLLLASDGTKIPLTTGVPA